MKTVIASQPWLTEPSLLPLPWRDEKSYLDTDREHKAKGRNLVERLGY